MANRRSAKRAFSRRWIDCVGAATLTAFVAATVDVGLVAAVVPVSTSVPLGLAMAWAQTLAIFGAFAIACATVLALAGRTRVKRTLARRGETLAFAAVWSLVAIVPLAALDAIFGAEWWEFPREIHAIHLGLSLGTVVGVLALAHASRAWFARTFEQRVPWRIRRFTAAAIVALASLATLVSAHLLLAPESLVAACGVAGVVALLLGVVASLAVVPRARTARDAAPALVLALAALAFFVPGAARDHARFLVWNHGAIAAPLAEALRDVADRDHDGSAPTWLTGLDCAEGDAKRGPLVREVPGDGIDQDCRGGDAPVLPPAPPATLPPDCHPPPPPARLSVLLVTIDALRADRATATTMPALAALAARGTTFTRAYAPTALTVTSTAALLTARPLADLVDNALKDDHLEAPSTIATLFASAGYRTGVFTAFEMHALSLRGFTQINGPWLDLSPIGAKETLTSNELARATLDFALASDAPFFAWVHFADVHARYKLDRDDAGRALSESDAYDRGVVYTGAALAHLLAALDERGALDRTIVVVTADHGEELMARGREGHGPNLYEEVTHVPLVVWIPGCAPRVVERPVGATQIGPTLGALTGVRVPGWGLFDARPLPVVTEATVGYDTQFKRAVVGPRYKLIVDVPNGGRALFDLSADPGETTNVYGSDPAASAEMESAYQRWLDAPGAR